MQGKTLTHFEFPGALYHVTSRGNARAPFFTDDADRQRFVALLADVIEHNNWFCIRQRGEAPALLPAWPRAPVSQARD